MYAHGDKHNNSSNQRQVNLRSRKNISKKGENATPSEGYDTFLGKRNEKTKNNKDESHTQNQHHDQKNRRIKTRETWNTYTANISKNTNFCFERETDKQSKLGRTGKPN